MSKEHNQSHPPTGIHGSHEFSGASQYPRRIFLPLISNPDKAAQVPTYTYATKKPTPEEKRYNVPVGHFNFEDATTKYEQGQWYTAEDILSFFLVPELSAEKQPSKYKAAIDLINAVLGTVRTNDSSLTLFNPHTDRFRHEIPANSLIAFGLIPAPAVERILPNIDKDTVWISFDTSIDPNTSGKMDTMELSYVGRFPNYEELREYVIKNEKPQVDKHGEPVHNAPLFYTEYTQPIYHCHAVFVEKYRLDREGITELSKINAGYHYHMDVKDDQSDQNQYSSGISGGETYIDMRVPNYPTARSVNRVLFCVTHPFVNFEALLPLSEE